MPFCRKPYPSPSCLPPLLHSTPSAPPCARSPRAHSQVGLLLLILAAFLVCLGGGMAQTSKKLISKSWQPFDMFTHHMDTVSARAAAARAHRTLVVPKPRLARTVARTNGQRRPPA